MKTRTIKILLGGVIASFIFTLIFTLVLTNGFVYAAEETTQSTEGAIKSAVDWIKSLSVEDIKGWLTALFVKLGIDAGTLIVLAISLIRSTSKRVAQDKHYQQLQDALNEEHRRQMKELHEDFNNRLAEVQNVLIEQVKNLDEKKKAEAESNIEVLKNNLENIKVELEK